MTNEKQKTILLVEDEIIIGTLGKRAIEKYGYNVILVNTGEKAVESSKKISNIDLILMDIDLGKGIDGTVAAETILKDIDIPVVFLSSHTEPAVVEKTEKITSYGYVVKGSSDTVLVASMKMAFKLFEANQKLKEQKKETEKNNDRLESLLRISQFQTNKIQELLDYALEEAINLTYSKIGYIYFYNESTQQFTLNTWSKEAMKECSIMEPQTIYDLDKTGCWGEAVRQRKPIVINDYSANNPHKKGTPEGHVLLLKFLTIPVIIDHKIVAVVGVANKKTDYDVSDIRQLTLLMDRVWKIVERITIMNALQLSEARYHEIIEDQNEFICRYLPNGRLSFVNGAYARYYKKATEDLIDKNFFPQIPEPDLSLVLQKLKGITVDNPLASFTHRIINSSGEIRWQRWTQRGIYSPEGNLIEYQATGFDITEPKLAEAALIAREERYRLLLESINDAVFIYELNADRMPGTFMEVNDLACERLEYTKNELLQLSPISIGKPPSNNSQDFSQIMWKFIAAKRLVIEWIHITKTGKEIPVEVSSHLFELQGKLTIISVVRDITERKQGEEKIKSLLTEKELILKEVHHRIKNNMHTMMGLLILQADAMENPTAVTALNDASSRMQSMGLLYDKLYRSNNTQEISAKDYLLSLIDEIVCNFPNKVKVQVEKKIDDFTLHTEKLQSLGILINELLTNIMKYAFIGREKGLITVVASLKTSPIGDTKTASITVLDDGNGIPETIDFENTTGFGLRLVGMLTQQLGGTIRIQRENGTKIILEFDL